MLANDFAKGSLSTTSVGIRNLRLTLAGGTANADLKIGNVTGTGTGITRLLTLSNPASFLNIDVVAISDRSGATLTANWDEGKSLPTTLTNGVSVTNLWGSSSFSTRATFSVPAGQKLLEFTFPDTTGGGSIGIYEVYIKYNRAPTSTSYDYYYNLRSFCSGGVCNFQYQATTAGGSFQLVPGIYHILIQAAPGQQKAYSGKYFKASYCVNINGCP